MLSSSIGAIICFAIASYCTFEMLSLYPQPEFAYFAGAAVLNFGIGLHISIRSRLLQ